MDDVMRFRKRYPDIQSHINLVSDLDLFDQKLDSMKSNLEDFKLKIFKQ